MDTDNQAGDQPRAVLLWPVNAYPSLYQSLEGLVSGLPSEEEMKLDLKNISFYVLKLKETKN